MAEDGGEGWLLRGGLRRRLDENYDVFVMSKHRSKAYFNIRVKSPFVWTRGLQGGEGLKDTLTEECGEDTKKKRRVFSPRRACCWTKRERVARENRNYKTKGASPKGWFVRCI
jgi:hypothetical protein